MLKSKFFRFVFVTMVTMVSALSAMTLYVSAVDEDGYWFDDERNLYYGDELISEYEPDEPVRVDYVDPSARPFYVTVRARESGKYVETFDFDDMGLSAPASPVVEEQYFKTLFMQGYWLNEEAKLFDPNGELVIQFSEQSPVFGYYQEYIAPADDTVQLTNEALEKAANIATYQAQLAEEKRVNVTKIAIAMGFSIIMIVIYIVRRRRYLKKQSTNESSGD